MREPAPASGLAALPLPSGDPSGLWRAAGWLRVAATQVESSPLTTTRALPAQVTDGWSGPAAQEAGSEAAVVGARSAALADRLTRAAAVLTEYGDALDAAQRVAVGLQTAYDDVRPAGPPPPIPTHPLALLGGAVGSREATEVAVVAGRYAVAMADLDLAGGVAAHRLRGLAAEVGDGPVGRGGQRSAAMWAVGTTDPDPGNAALRGLPLVTAALHRTDADRAAGAVVDALTSVSAGDAWAVSTATVLLDGWARDPVFAQSLWARLSPGEVAAGLLRVAARSPTGGTPSAVSAAWREEQEAALLRGLGSALAVAANPGYAVGLDPVTAARLDDWRSRWLDRVAGAVDEVVHRPDGTTVDGAWVQGRLLVAATLAGLAPGALYATTVGVAVVRADVRAGSTGRAAFARPSATALLAPNGCTGTVSGLSTDPVLAMTEALMADPAAARVWLLHPLPGSPGRMVVDHLVDTRYLDLDPASGAVAMSGVARLVVSAGSDPTSREGTLVTAAYLDAVGRTALDTPHPAVFRKALAPALNEVGSLLGAHADALTATLDDSAAPGTDVAGLTPAERLVRRGREPGTWEVVLSDRSTASALVGALALDGFVTPAARDPASAPALARAMGGIGATLENDLVAAIAARPTRGETDEIVVTARRLGATTGFVLTSAGATLALQDEDLDAEHQRLAGLAELAVSKITVPGAAGRLASPVVRAAADQVVVTALPTGSAAAQRAASAAAVAQQRDDVLTAVRTLVSRAHPWTIEQSPPRWAARMATAGSPVPFWDTAGLPLPEPEMTTAQRRSFSDWRRDEGLDVYDTVPQVVRDAIDSGVRDAVATRPPGPPP